MDFNLNLFSKYRTQLMGFAMMWIITFHLGIIPENQFLRVLRSLSHMAVDMFIFLSGVGVYFSYIAAPDAVSFYRNRLLRIMPAFILTGIIFSLIAYFTNRAEVVDVIKFFLLIGFGYELNSLVTTPWFIPNILFLYLFTPLFMFFFNKKNKTTLIVCIIILLFLYALVLNRPPLHLLGIFIFARMTNYLFGLYVGSLIQKKTILNTSQVLLVWLGLAFGVFLFVLRKEYGYMPSFLPLQVLNMWLPNALLCFAYCTILCQILQKFKNYKFPILTFFGKYSLTIYLSHECIQAFLREIGTPYYHALGVIITCIFAYIIQNIIERFLKRPKTALINVEQ